MREELTGNVPGKAASNGTIDVFGAASQLVSAASFVKGTYRLLQHCHTDIRILNTVRTGEKFSFRLQLGVDLETDDCFPPRHIHILDSRY